MSRRRSLGLGVSAAAVVLGAAVYATAHGGATPVTVTPANMPRIGAVDERFQSFNIEMVEVTGGRFWKPYSQIKAVKSQPAAGQSSANQPSGMSPDLYQYRPPIDLTNPRLRKLAAALGPAYMRVSGTWANTTYFQNSDEAAPPTPPKGFKGVLTRKEWKGVVDFSHAVDAKIVTSFATSAGARDSSGVWTPSQARPFLAYTKSIGGTIAAAEFMNEPTFAAIGGAPQGYDAAAFGRDVAAFIPFVKKAAPDMLILGPGSVGEGGSLGPMKLLKSEDLLKATGPVFDVFTYHFYGAVSKRCASMGATAATTTAAAALSENWLSRADKAEAFYGGLRDRFEPGKPLWVTETADAACGGDPWASSFLDTFRYLDQHASLAKRGVGVIMHNTLAASDYGLLDENTLAPRPNYWAALLWRNLMGTTVLNAGPSPAPSLRLYAHCLRDHSGGVALLAINTDRANSQQLDVPVQSDRYTLTAKDLLDKEVQLNGSELKLDADGNLPSLKGAPAQPGKVVFAPASITFLAIADAKNSSCQ